MAGAKFMLVCVVCVNIFAQPAGRGVISGAVFDAATGEPVRKAIVTVTWHGTPHSWATMRTDGSGKFSFDGLPAGKYDLAARKSGLGTAIYGAANVRELGDLLTLGDGEVHADIKLWFLRSASISGRVVDAEGEPVSGANVTLLRPTRQFGDRTLANGQGATTNDRGEFKITGLDPGQYYLRCIPNGGGFFRNYIVYFPGPEQPPREMMVPQFYGGARDSKDAAPVILRGGDALTGIDFHLTSERPATISGRVTGVPALDPPVEPSMAARAIRGRPHFDNQLTVSLRPADDDSLSFGSSSASQASDYHFEMSGNIPGRYRVESMVRTKDKNYYASQVVDAHEGNNEVSLAMVPGVEVKGHLRVEGPAANPEEGFTVMLAGAGQYSSKVKKDGSFTIQDVPPGEWMLNINGGSSTFQKSVRLGDKDFLLKRLEIPPGLDAPLNIVISSNIATVSGGIDAGGKGAGILLAPVGRLRAFTRFYYSSTADDEGKFKLNGIAPGKYKMFALEKINPVNYRDPESADLLDAFGEELEIAEGAKMELHPKLIPEEKAKEILKP